MHQQNDRNSGQQALQQVKQCNLLLKQEQSYSKVAVFAHGVSFQVEKYSMSDKVLKTTVVLTISCFWFSYTCRVSKVFSMNMLDVEG